MVRGFFLAARPTVDIGAAQPVGRLGRAQKMIDAEPGVALPAASGIIPEGVKLVVKRVERAKRIGPPLRQDSPLGGARLGL